MFNLVVFFFWRPGGSFDAIPGSALAFYVWVSIFGLFVVAEFWAFAADIYTDERGRRSMPMLAIGICQVLSRRVSELTGRISA